MPWTQLLDRFRPPADPPRWRRPRRFDRNLIVIGGGSAGLVSAYIAAATRARVTLVEAGAMGGDCLNTGCVPSKALIQSARLAHQMRGAEAFGLRAPAPEVCFASVMERVHQVIAEIAPHDSVARYQSLGVEVLQGRARLVDPWTVEVALASGETRRLTTAAVILATGARPAVPAIPGIEAVDYLTSETMWQRLRHRARVPGRMLVLGGGPIGCEMAQAFARLGASVTLVEPGPRLLPREDAEVGALIAQTLAREGVRVLTGHRALSCGQDAAGKWAEIAGEGASFRLDCDEILLATGRRPRLEGLGLEELGFDLGQGLQANGFLQTRFAHILAAGDVVGPLRFTHAASHQAWHAAVNALFGGLKRFAVDTRVIPWATFTAPEVARLGLNEDEARARGIPHEVTRFALADLDRAIADGATQGFVKVLTVPGRDRILGVTLVGEQAAELIAEFVLAMKAGLGLGKILGTVHIYPTLAEANKSAAGAWRRAHVNPRLLTLVAAFHRWRRG